MKNLNYLLVFILIQQSLNYSYCRAQNLVPNPSFEDTISCPNLSGQISNAVGWYSLCGSPDLFYSCYYGVYGVGEPYNFGGFQHPASGNGYSGVVTYSNAAPDTREFASCDLLSPLVPGTKYYVSFKTSLALTSYSQANFATNNLGIRFIVSSNICNDLINNNPQIFTSSIITDTLNWTRITGSFIADSAYATIVIGNFFNDSLTDTLKFFNDFLDIAYYFIDDVCISTDSIFTLNYNFTSINNNFIDDNISFFPNPFSDKLRINGFGNEIVTINLFNALGEILYTTLLTNNVVEINLSDFQGEFLILNINSENKIANYKLLKLKL